MIKKWTNRVAYSRYHRAMGEAKDALTLIYVYIDCKRDYESGEIGDRQFAKLQMLYYKLLRVYHAKMELFH